LFFQVYLLPEDADWTEYLHPHLTCLIHKLYIFQSLWIIQVNPDIENVGFHFS